MFILPHGTWKDNVRSVILDWSQRFIGRPSEGEKSAGLSSEERDPLVTQADLSPPPSQKGSPPRKKDMCEISLTVFLHTHNRRRRRIETWIIFLDIYESFVVYPAVHYTRRFLRCSLVSSCCLVLVFLHFYSFRVFHTKICLWSVRDIKFPQLPRFLRILADLRSIVVWLVLVLTPGSKSSIPLSTTSVLHYSELFEIELFWYLTVCTLTILSLNNLFLVRTVWLKWMSWKEMFWLLNCVLKLNWIVWNRIVYLYKNGFLYLITYKVR